MSIRILIATGLGLATTLVLIPLALRFDWGALLPRRSTEWHHVNIRPVPRVGGAILVCAFVLVEFWIAMFYPELRARTPGRDLVVLSSVAMFALGFWDDLRPLSASRKLVLQVVIAAVAWYGGLAIEVWRPPFFQAPLALGVWSPILTIGWLVCLTNLINLIDGLDSLAGGLCLMLLVLVAVMAHQNDNFELLACGMAGALLGFLRYNVPPARIYLGDGGAYFLGFQIGLYSVVNSHKGTVLAVLIAPLFALALPISDAVLTVTRRGLRGLPLFRPDRKHLHHRLPATGYSRRKALFTVHALNAVFMSMGFAVFWSNGRWTSVMVAALVLVLLICAWVCRFSRRWFAIHRVVRGCLRMRGTVRQALALGRGLELEARQQAGPSEFWPALILAADKLGFASLELTLQGESRRWRRSGTSTGSARLFECPHGMKGTLELKAPACPLARSIALLDCDRNSECLRRRVACLADPRVFDTISELLAEAWNKAAAHWDVRHGPLRFGLAPPCLNKRVSGSGALNFDEASTISQVVKRSNL